LPDDATITSVKLRLFVTAKGDGDARSLVGEWYGAGNWPIGAGDWSLDSSADALAGVAISTIATSASNDFMLANGNGVSLTGSTGLRLHIDGGVPTAANTVQFATYEHTTEPEPQLIVEWTAGTPSPPSNTLLPSVSGEVVEGETLTGGAGGWSGSEPISYAYQWRRCDAAGASCVDVAGATATSYVLVGDDVGSTIRLKVIASNEAGSSEASSEQTAVVAAGTTSGTSTFSVLAMGDDGYVDVAGATYPPRGTPRVHGWKLAQVSRGFVSGTYAVETALLRFDTSGLPDDATITSVKLRLFVTAKGDGDARSLVGEWYGAGNWPIGAGGWSLDSSADALAGVAISTIATSASNDFMLANGNGVSLTGSTGLRLHIDGGVPTAANTVQFATYEHTTQPEPQLIVEWTRS